MRATSSGGAAAMSVEGYDLLGELWNDGPYACHRARERATGRLVRVEAPRAYPYEPHQRDERNDKLRVVALLDHPNLVPTLAVGECEYGVYLVRPWLDATPIDVSGPLPLGDA